MQEAPAVPADRAPRATDTKIIRPTRARSDPRPCAGDLRSIIGLGAKAEWASLAISARSAASPTRARLDRARFPMIRPLAGQVARSSTVASGAAPNTFPRVWAKVLGCRSGFVAVRVGCAAVA